MVKYKVELNREDCIGCGTCYSGGGLHFEADEGGYSRIVGDETIGQYFFRIFDDENMELAKMTAKYCPVSAITVSEV